LTVRFHKVDRGPLTVTFHIPYIFHPF